MTQPSAAEQYLLELINAERAQAGAQPLAFDGDLNEAAEDHSEWMIATDTFSHTGSGGSTAGQRMSAAGYVFTGSWSWGENIAWATTRAPAGYQDEVQLLHTSLMNSSGHRANILNDTYREVGLGFEIGEYNGRETAFITEDFAKSGSSIFLTGVAFDDMDGDHFYDPGEGLGGLTVTAVGSTGATYVTTTWDAGGYDLVLPSGNYTVTFSGEGIAPTTMQTTIGSKNVKLDLVDPAMGGGGSSDTVYSSENFWLPANMKNLVLLGSDDLQGYGNDLSNEIHGNSGNNLLDGGAGNDVINGGAGNDVMLGRAGDNTMAGGAGNDTYVVESLGDVVVENVGEGADSVIAMVSNVTLAANVEVGVVGLASGLTLNGNGLDNALFGSSGNDVLNGGAGNDGFDGGAGNDVINGGAGNDSINGGAGDDTMVGGAGNDTYVVDSLGDVVVENVGEGTDTVIAMVSNGTLAANVEVGVVGLASGLTLNGNGLDNTLVGSSGNDVLNGGAGNDVMLGRAGDDTMAGGAGNDTYVVESLGDVVMENVGEGADSVIAMVSNVTLAANVEVGVVGLASGLTLNGNGLDNALFGSSGNDVLNGGAGNDGFDSGAGNDVINGGAGNDSMNGGAGDDTFVFAFGDGFDHVMDFTAGDSSGDLIELTGYGVATFAQLQTLMSEVGSDVTIAFDGNNQITLHDVTLTQLNQNDFLLA